jgi:hypothetical protein
METGECISHTSRELVFTDADQCEQAAIAIQGKVYDAIDDPTALILAQCVNWGDGV